MRRDLIFVLLASLVLVAPLATWQRELPNLRLRGREVDLASLREQRMKAQMPKALSADLPRQLERYVTDRLGFRTSFIKLKSLVEVGVLGSSTHNAVLLGRDGWLFLSDAIDENASAQFLPERVATMAGTLGGYRFSESQLKQACKRLEGCRRALALRGITFVLAIAPNKQSIYPDKTGAMPRVLPPNRTDDLIGALRRSTAVTVADLRKPLRAYREASDAFPVFWKLDSHWNDLGAQLAAVDLLKKLKPDDPGATGPDRHGFEPRWGGNVGDGDLATNLLAAQELFNERDVSVVPKASTSFEEVRDFNPFRDFREDAFAARRNPSRTGTLLFCGDSFGNRMRNTLSEEFREAYFQWDYDVNEPKLRVFRPTVVVLEVVERRLEKLLEIDLLVEPDAQGRK